MRNPGYVHELASSQLSGADVPDTNLNGVSRADLDVATAALAPLSEWQRREMIHALYVKDALARGYAVGDPAGETTWILRQRAHDFYSREEGG